MLVARSANPGNYSLICPGRREFGGQGCRDERRGGRIAIRWCGPFMYGGFPRIRGDIPAIRSAGYVQTENLGDPRYVLLTGQVE